jgi:hypothetical protein
MERRAVTEVGVDQEKAAANEHVARGALVVRSDVLNGTLVPCAAGISSSSANG